MRLKRRFVWAWMILMVFLFAACSSSNENAESSKDKSSADMKVESNEDGETSEEVALSNSSQQEGESVEEIATAQTTRKIIYQSFLSIRVKDFEKSQTFFTNEATKMGGYLVQSNVYQADQRTKGGELEFRIPSENFQSFINLTSEEAVEVEDKQISGQDVTEEYVDLESRLKAKRVVEERLLTFMKEAEKTEDLLKISNDLSKVQEEIEQVVGRLRFLENQTSFATVRISMNETKVIVEKANTENLQTGKKIANQWNQSINGLISFFSALAVFFIGNLPTFIVIGFVLAPIVYILVRMRKRQNETNINS
ncbi:DUF4349 domain-containing protein [Bacillus sp. 2205SS5-2]|uniref:DUF4349 domain-containing protein n=1 Tax=Bacillus sp. 2205SS5-2 TaxID=3109031 RepID=UPI0030074865